MLDISEDNMYGAAGGYYRMVVKRLLETVFFSALLMSLSVNANGNDMWLVKMNKAIRSMNYTGTYIHINQGQIETMQIVHAVDEAGERERLLSLNGEAREILRDDNHVTCILPADRFVVVGQLESDFGLPALVPDNILQLGEIYDIQLIGKDRIAGYPSVILSIQPKDKMRYGYRIWLEKDHGMLLRSDILDAEGRVMEQMMFTQISFQSPVSDEMLRPTVPHKDFVTVESSEHGVGVTKDKSAWILKGMPKGFKVTGQARKRMPMNKFDVEHIVLSDGLATISVYIEKSPGVNTLQGSSSIGGINAYGRSVYDHQVTVMGEVPKETVKQIAYSIAYSN